MGSRLIVFNDVDRQDLRRDWANGVPMADIAADFGVSENVIRRHVHEMGLPMRYQSQTNRWQPHEDRLLRELVLAKVNYRIIGERMKRTRNSVISRSHRLGFAAEEPRRRRAA